jgi:cytoskeletal protein RodZ
VGFDNHPPPSEIVGEMTLGEGLRRAREDAGLSLDELAHITNLRSSLILLIEKDDFSQCGGDTYARGHIRNIARAVGVSPEEFLAQFDAEHSTDSRSIHAQLVDNNAAAIRSENRKLSWKVLAGASLSIAVLIGVAQFSINALDSESTTSELIAEPVEPSAVPMSPSATPSVSPSATTETATSTGGPLQLVIAATRGNSNIHVVVVGKTLYKGPLFQGEEKTFLGENSISIYLGNAGDLDLTLNGEKLAPLGERNQEIRKTFRAK